MVTGVRTPSLPRNIISKYIEYFTVVCLGHTCVLFLKLIIRANEIGSRKNGLIIRANGIRSRENG